MKRILGIDYGVKRIGLAISDFDKTTAVGKGVIENKGDQAMGDEIARICIENDVDTIVLGLPLHLSGEESESSLKVRDFANIVAEKGFEIKFEDERMTTIQSAKPILFEKKKYRQRKDARDQGAAVLILQNFLDRLNRG